MCDGLVLPQPTHALPSLKPWKLQTHPLCQLHAQPVSVKVPQEAGDISPQNEPVPAHHTLCFWLFLGFPFPTLTIFSVDSEVLEVLSVALHNFLCSFEANGWSTDWRKSELESTSSAPPSTYFYFHFSCYIWNKQEIVHLACLFCISLCICWASSLGVGSTPISKLHW